MNAYQLVETLLEFSRKTLSFYDILCLQRVTCRTFVAVVLNVKLQFLFSDETRRDDESNFAFHHIIGNIEMYECQ